MRRSILTLGSAVLVVSVLALVACHENASCTDSRSASAPRPIGDLAHVDGERLVPLPEPHDDDRCTPEAEGPATVDAPAGDAGPSPEPPVPGSIPVLLYHGLCVDACPPEATYDVTRAEFDATLTEMAARGYRTISIAAYAAWLAGGPKPGGRPVLVTFDDGRRVGYELADPVLAKHGARATMYMITGFVRNETPTEGDRFMAWSQVVDAYTSGRWDIDLHAHLGHARVEVAVGEDGAPVRRSFYAWRRLLDGGTESFAQWHARVTADLDEGARLLASRLPGWEAHSFALPFGDYGQGTTNDPAIPITMAAMLDARYPAWFVQPSERELPTPPRDPSEHTSHRSGRYAILRTTTTADVLRWLDEAYVARDE